MFSYPSLSVSTEMMVVYTTKKDITHLWYGEPNAVRDAIGYAKYRSRSDKAVIRVYELLHIPGPFSGVTNQAGKPLRQNVRDNLVEAGGDAAQQRLKNLDIFRGLA
jgi:predicted metallopeptidase